LPTDQLVLRTVDGAADLLVEELRTMSSIHSIRQVSPGLVRCTVDGSLDELAGCALFSTVAVVDPEKSVELGVLALLPRPVRFRVGVEDPARRRTMIGAVEQRFGWVNRPRDWDVNLVPSDDEWLAEVGPLSWTRRFGSLERLPWSTNRIVAEVLVRLAKIRPGDRVLDPFCGTGTILNAVRRREPTTRVLGTDHDPHALHLAVRNISADANPHFEKPPTISSRGAWLVASQSGWAGATALVARAEAGALPVLASSVERVVSNLPFGKQVGSHHLNRTLYPAVLQELDRILTPDGRAVLLTEDKRVLRSALDRQRSLKLVRERLLRYSGATPTAFVLTRTTTSRRRGSGGGG
jgi:SAM-dependent methyltransferase